MLSRPLAKVNGERKIPKLVNTMGIPFLRFKKPQSHYLSRIIRNKITTHQRRIDRSKVLDEEIGIAQDEDEWDDLLRRHGLRGFDSEEMPWQYEAEAALGSIRSYMKTAAYKAREHTKAFWAIVEKETELAEQERREVRIGKGKAVAGLNRVRKRRSIV